MNQSFFCLLSCSEIRKTKFEVILFLVWKRHVYRKQKLPTFPKTKEKNKAGGWLWGQLTEKHITSENFSVDHNKALSASEWYQIELGHGFNLR